MAAKDCVTRISEQFKDLDREVIQEIVNEVENLRRKSKNSADFNKKSKEHFESVKKFQARKLAQKIEDIQKLDTELGRVLGPDFKEAPWEALESIFTGTERLTQGGNRSIFLDSMAIGDEAKRMLSDALEEEGLLKIAKEGSLDKDVYIAINQMARKQEVTVSPEAQRLANTYSKIYNYLQDNMELSGSMRNRLDGYLRRRHDAIRIEQAGFEKWKTKLLEGLDVEESFGTTDTARINDSLREDYENIVLGEYDSGFIQSGTGKFIELKGAGLDSRLSKKRAYVFKNGELESAYMSEFGDGTLLENLINSIERDARNSATINRLGSNPRLAYETIKSEVKRSMRGNPELSKRFKAKEGTIDDLFENTVLGFRHGSSMTAKVSANLRSISSMALLGKAVIKAGTTDIATQASLLKAKTGQGWFEAWGKTMSGMGKSLGAANRKEMMKRFKIYVDQGLGEYWSRFNPDDVPGGAMSRASNTFFKLNLMRRQNEMWKTANNFMWGAHLGDISKHSWDALSPHDSANMGRYGITAKDWDHIRTASENVNGTNVITPYAVDQIQGMPARQKRELKFKLSAYLRENAEYLGSPTPDVGVRSRMLGRVDPNTILGQTVHFMAQFKNFGLTAVKVARHIMMSNPEHAGKSLKQILREDWKSPVMNMSGLMLGTTTMAGIGMMAEDLAAGKRPEGADYFNADFFTRAMVNGGGMGIYGDFIFGEYDKSYQSFAQVVLGPVLGGTFNTTAELWSGLRKGEPNASKAFRLLINNVPGSNLFYTRAALDYLFLDEIQDTLTPGYKRRKRKRMRDQGQEWLLDF